MKKIFEEELSKIFKKLQNKIPFAFSKYADGEWAIIKGNNIANGEFSFINDINSSFYRKKLIESFKFKHPNYYVGISCECCQGGEHQKMKLESGQEDDNLTFANVFVNSNYSFYKEKFIPEYQNHEIYLVANKNSKIENLPFKLKKFYGVDETAFIINYPLIEEIKKEQIKDSLFLFCAGPFGNILAHQLFEYNQNNIYLDIGSTLNPWLQSEGFKRGYYNKESYQYQTCIWKD
jgi:hypothetical protein